MPQFFLSVRQGQDAVADPEPYEFPDLDTARSAAELVARDVIDDRPQIDSPASIEIADEAGRTLISLDLVAFKAT